MGVSGFTCADSGSVTAQTPSVMVQLSKITPHIPSTGASQPHPRLLQLTVCVISCIYSGNEARGKVKQHVRALFYSENLEIRPSCGTHVPAGPSGVQRKASNLLFSLRSIFNLPVFLYLKKKKIRTELMGKCLLEK